MTTDNTFQAAIFLLVAVQLPVCLFFFFFAGYKSFLKYEAKCDKYYKTLNLRQYIKYPYEYN